jgi:hypothetical protein
MDSLARIILTTLPLAVLRLVDKIAYTPPIRDSNVLPTDTSGKDTP